ncbi:MAG: AraC family transcriptional regulator [Pseudomonadota bacterium]
MTEALPDAYCFFQEIEPRAPLVARFDRDYLLHAVAGALQVEVEGKRWSLPSSFAAWVPADTEMRVTLDRPVTSCSILVKPGKAQGLPDRPTAFQMTRLTREMTHHCRAWGKDDPHPPEAAVFFRALLATCAGLMDNAIDVCMPSSDDPALSRAIAFTERHIEEALAAEAVAKAAGMSERTMQRRFVAELGESWGQTLTRIRMIQAVKLLALGEMSVIQIAGACGYASISAFNRNFKAYSGLSPSDFKKSIV